MKGLELSRRFFADVALSAFKEKAANALGSMAFGLVGPGSECYGFDDEISRDHDWGPRVCIWIPEELYQEQGERLQRIYDELNEVFLGYGPVHRLDTRVRRDGILSTPCFYRSYLGTESPPTILRDWLLLPEEALSVCTNGEVFVDSLGSFTGMRRGDTIAFHHHKTRFTWEAAALAFLLARSYRPFSKWIFHGLRGLGPLGSAVHGNLLQITRGDDKPTLQATIEGCLGILIDELVNQKLAEPSGTFLLDYGVQIQRHIGDPTLREGLDSVD